MRILVVSYCLLFLLGCEKSITDNDKAAIQIPTSNEIIAKNNAKETTEHKFQGNRVLLTENSQRVNYLEIEWTDLLPITDLDALLNPPEYIMDLEEGSTEDQIAMKMQGAMNNRQGTKSSYEKALISTNIIEAMDKKNIEIPGFIVPVEFNDEQVVTSFFLVPYFGACLHMPPPPPNQIIYIEIENGFILESFYDPVVISGKLSVALFEDQIATSAYTMTMDKIRMYYED